MKLRYFLIFSAVVAGFFGLALLLIPAILIKSNHLVVSEPAKLFARASGGALIGMAIVNLFASKDKGSDLLWGVVLANLVIQSLTFITDAAGINLGFSLGVHGLFILGFGYFYLKHLQGKS